MAKQWIKKHTTDVVGFDVLNVKPADRKKGYGVAEVKYPTTDTIYTYVRKVNNKSDGTKVMVLDGCEVKFVGGPNGPWTIQSVTRIYDTSDTRRETVEPQTEGKTKSVIESIKDEVESKQIPVPAPVVDFPKGEVHHDQYETIKSCLQCKIPVYLAGPAGSGKNHTVEQICKELGWDFYFSNSAQQEYKLTGFIDAGGQFHETEFYKACTSAVDCVFFLDEMDASIPEVLVLLNAAIANGYFEFPNGRVTLENVHFVAAGNTLGSGADEMYTGRMVLDQATLDRFAIIQFDYCLNIELAITKGNAELVSFIRQLRADAADKGIRATFSYRCMTMVTKLEKAGMDTRQILTIAVLKGLDKDTINTFSIGGVSKYHTALRQMQGAA